MTFFFYLLQTTLPVLFHEKILVSSPYKRALTGTRDVSQWYRLCTGWWAQSRPWAGRRKCQRWAVCCVPGCPFVLPSSATASLKTMFQPSLSSYFHTEDEGSKKAGVRFRTTGIINYIQMTTLLRDKGLESLILEASRIEILCKQISDYRTEQPPQFCKATVTVTTVLITSTKGSYSGDQRASMCWSKAREHDLAVGQAEWILQWMISQPQQVLRVDMKHQFSKLLTKRCHWIGS